MLVSLSIAQTRGTKNVGSFMLGLLSSTILVQLLYFFYFDKQMHTHLKSVSAAMWGQKNDLGRLNIRFRILTQTLSRDSQKRATKFLKQPIETKV